MLVIDWQNKYFKLHVANSKYMAGAIEKTAQIISQARERGDQIVWIAYSSEEDVFETSGQKDSLHTDLKKRRQDSDPCFRKTDCDTFTNPNFEAWLSSQDFDRLIFTGHHINDCVMKTLSSAISRGYGPKCILVRDACGPAPTINQTSDYAFNQLRNYGGVICAADRLLAYWSKKSDLKSLPNTSRLRHVDEEPLRRNGCMRISKEPYFNQRPYHLIRKYIESLQKGLSLNTLSEAFIRIVADKNGIDESLITKLETDPSNAEYHEAIAKAAGWETWMIDPKSI